MQLEKSPPYKEEDFLKDKIEVKRLFKDNKELIEGNEALNNYIGNLFLGIGYSNYQSTNIDIYIKGFKEFIEILNSQENTTFIKFIENEYKKRDNNNNLTGELDPINLMELWGKIPNSDKSIEISQIKETTENILDNKK